MTLDELSALLAAATEDLKLEPSHWRFVFQGVPMVCLSDAGFDRMRFIAPIIEVAKLDEATKDELLEANFHTALDARYASSGGLLFATFIHPIASLDATLARSALDQVASLVRTFGTHYTSGALEFVAGSELEVDEGDGDGGDDPDEGGGGLLLN